MKAASSAVAPLADIATWGVRRQRKAVAEGELTARALVSLYLDRVAHANAALGAYLAVDAEAALAAADELDRVRASGAPLGALAGVPLGIKDVIVTRGLVTTAASKMLEGWMPPYDATVLTRLRAAGALVLGKLNCDEFAMGSTNEHSAYGPCKNPWDLARVPGGSSGGSAAAVAAGLCAASLGSDTGGSIRQPASFCGVAGMKPTYGLVSRYGLISYASSLDQIGPMGRSVDDVAAVLEVLIAHDPNDATSAAPEVAARVVAQLQAAVAARALAGGAGAGADAAGGGGASLAGLRVGVPREYLGEGVAAEVQLAVAQAADMLRDAGAEVTEISLPHTALAMPAYYLIAPAEASANLARFDGIRFGPRLAAPDAPLGQMYEQARGNGFGREVKRRIMLGTFALRTGFYDAYFKKAQQVRALIRRDFEHMPVDMVLAPTAPTPAFALGQHATADADPAAMYMADIHTLACNLAGIPGLAVPVSMAGTLPVGVQLLGRWFDDANVLRAGAAIEARAGMLGKRPPAWEMGQGGAQ